MTINLVPYAPIFVALGTKLNLSTDPLDINVAEYPKGKKSLIEAAVKDISLFIDTKTSEDTIGLFGFVDFIDNKDLALEEATKENLRNLAPCYQNGKYIAQEISLLKVNKSWHTSEVANECSHFTTLCTNRGVEEIKGKRGRKATRQPNEYHSLKPNGQIAREQLTTPSIMALCEAIPKEVIISATKNKSFITLEQLQSMELEDIKALLASIKK